MAFKIIIDKDLLKQLYLEHINGESVKDIALKNNINKVILCKRFAENNMPIIKRQYLKIKHLKISKEDEFKIIELYNNNNTAMNIAKLYNVYNCKIIRILNKNNINTKFDFSKKEFRDKKKIYSLNENFFKTVDTSEKAYILGFLYADGNASSNHKHITLGLQERDKYILEKIASLLETNRPLHFIKKRKETHQNKYLLNISNKIIYEDLISLGVVPNKTFKIKFPNQLPIDLIPHFIRGYFDGDGCIYVNKKVFEIKIIGASQFCKELQVIFNNLNIKSYIDHDPRCSVGIDEIRIRNKQDVNKFGEFIYNNSTIHLIRKFDKFQCLVKYLQIPRNK